MKLSTMPPVVAANTQMKAIVNDTKTHLMAKGPNLAKMAENGKEEVAAGRNRDNLKNKGENGDTEDAGNIRRHAARVAAVQKVQDIQKLLLNGQDPKDIAIQLAKASSSQSKLNSVLNEQGEQGSMLTYAAIDLAIQSDNISDEQRKNLEVVRENYQHEYSTQLLSWSHSRDAVLKVVDDHELATATLTLLGRMNAKKTDFLGVYSEILKVAGKEKFTAVTSAYRKAITEDLSKHTPSNNPIYLAQTLNKISEVSKAESALHLAKEKYNKLRKNRPQLEKGSYELLITSTAIMENPTQKFINESAISFVGLGPKDRYSFAHESRALINVLPGGLWSDQQHKSAVDAAMKHYCVTQSSSTDLLESEARNRFDIMVS